MTELPAVDTTPWSCGMNMTTKEVYVDMCIVEGSTGPEPSPPSHELLFTVGTGHQALRLAEHIVAAHNYYIRYYGNVLLKEEQFHLLFGKKDVK